MKLHFVKLAHFTKRLIKKIRHVKELNAKRIQFLMKLSKNVKLVLKMLLFLILKNKYVSNVL